MQYYFIVINLASYCNEKVNITATKIRYNFGKQSDKKLSCHLLLNFYLNILQQTLIV